MNFQAYLKISFSVRAMGRVEDQLPRFLSEEIWRNASQQLHGLVSDLVFAPDSGAACASRTDPRDLFDAQK